MEMTDTIASVIINEVRKILTNSLVYPKTLTNVRGYIYIDPIDTGQQIRISCGYDSLWIVLVRSATFEQPFKVVLAETHIPLASPTCFEQLIETVMDYLPKRA